MTPRRRLNLLNPAVVLESLLQGGNDITDGIVGAEVRRMKLRLGPLNWIFSMAELHRWHHSKLVDESNTNYGQNLILWDTVFGTRHLPGDCEPPADIGLTTGPAGFPMTYGAQLLAPVRWKRIVGDTAS